jgi:hypothetical protein
MQNCIDKISSNDKLGLQKFNEFIDDFQVIKALTT